MIREAELFVMAQAILTEVVARIRPGRWTARLPPLLDVPGFDAPCSMRAAVTRLVREDAQLPDLLAGRTPVDPGGDLLGEDPHAAVVQHAGAAADAARAVTDAGAPVHEPTGDTTAGELLFRLALSRSFLAHDIAVQLGSRACPLTEELARGLCERTEPDAARWRERGMFREPLTPVPDDVSWRDRFLMAAGRDPHPWVHR